jgi:hypothetical protein
MRLIVAGGCGPRIGLLTCPKKKAPNAGARLGGNPYMSLKSVTDSTTRLGYKYVTSRTKVWKLVTVIKHTFPFEN